MIGVLIAVLVAFLVWWLCIAIGLPSVVAIVAAILVLLAGIGGGWGYGRRGAVMLLRGYALGVTALVVAWLVAAHRMFRDALPRLDP